MLRFLRKLSAVGSLPFTILLPFILVLFVAIVACTALLDWHLHDSKVLMDEKSIEIEGEPGSDPCRKDEECFKEPSKEAPPEVEE